MRKPSPVWAPYWGGLTLALIACGGEALDVGSDAVAGGTGGSGNNTGAGGGDSDGGTLAGTSGSAGSTLPAGPELVPWPDTSTCEPDTSAPIDGTWTGYVQSPTSDFPDNGTFVVTFAGLRGDELCGNVTFGQGEPPPAPSDPGAPYPPGNTYPGMGSAPGSALPGLPYTILAGSMVGARLLLRISFSEFLRDWCPLQTPYLLENGDSYNCLPLGSSMAGNGVCYFDQAGEWVEVSCTQLEYCSFTLCECNREGCEASQQTGVQEFDINVEGNKAQGDLGGFTVYLERAQ